MIPYFCVIFLPILPFLYFKSSYKQRNKRSITLFFLLLSILLFLRSENIGRDISGYKYMFGRFSEYSWSMVFTESREPAYLVLNKLVSVFTDDFQWFLVVCAVITILPMLFFFRMETENSLLSISIYITLSNFIMLFSGIRQSISISIGIIAFLFAKKRKFIPFLLAVLLAYFFHNSAVILILLYPMYHANLDKKWLVFIIPTFILVLVFNRPIFVFLSSFFSGIYEASVIDTGAYAMVILFVAFAVFSYVIPNEKLMTKEITGLRNLLVLSAILQIFALLNNLAMRMNYYFMVFIPIALPKIISISKIKYKKIAQAAAFIMIVFFYAYYVLTSERIDALHIYPYEFFWEVK